MKYRILSLIVAFAAAVSSAAVPALDLNGSWQFRFEEGRSIAQAGNPAFVPTGTIAVPGCYDMLPAWLCRRGTGLYRRTFTLDRAVPNAWLVIDGMGLVGNFKIDGRDLGIHPYPYAKLELETGPLAAGTHTLYAALDNRFDWETLKLARPYYDFYLFGGFYHGVSLAFDNRRFLVRTRDYAKGVVEIEAAHFAQGDFDTTLVFDGRNEVSASFKGGRATVSVPDFRLWSPESPSLHTVALKDGLSARFGIRTVEARDRRLWLNGKPLYLKGANRHESHPTFGAATPEALMVQDIQNLKSLGGNFFRGCHYQQAQRFLDLCDENGILVWEESLGWGNGSHGGKMSAYELTNEVFCAQQVHETKEMVRASFNHPSVIIFAFMNEFASGSKPGKALADRLISTIKAEDSGRLVTYACCHNDQDIANANTDLVSFNTYPGWIGSDAGSPEHLKQLVEESVARVVARFRKLYPQKPIIVSEMGTCGVYGHHDPAGAQWTEEFQAEYVGDVLDAVFAHPEIAGMTIWQFTDARSYHRGGATIRSKPFAENLAGLYDGYRREKAVVPVVRTKFAVRPAIEN
ncbi:MAG: glycoside hydrolase family 2 TIM barrel-domain containing protein [Kiritimatiellae bacterium]|nr:glycoside hydrolase family 2 TIM barrel-domain containing protein [Kiritimatiellia bacterium]